MSTKPKQHSSQDSQDKAKVAKQDDNPKLPPPPEPMKLPAFSAKKVATTLGKRESPIEEADEAKKANKNSQEDSESNLLNLRDGRRLRTGVKTEVVPASQSAMEKPKALKVSDPKSKKKAGDERDSLITEGGNQILSSQRPSAAPARQFLYKPFVLLPDMTELVGKVVEVKVHKLYLTKFNKAVQQRQFYGNDLYSSDSDVVCILQHQGKINLTDRVPSNFEGVSIYFKINRPKPNYISQYRNGIKSQRKKSGYEGNSMKFEGYEFLQHFGDESELAKLAEIMPNRRDNDVSIKRLIKQNQKKRVQVSKLADVAKKAVWPALVFNLSLEPAFKFNLCVFGDKSQEVTARTSYMLQSQVIYLETQKERYEIAKSPKEGPKKEGEDHPSSLYTFSKVLNPYELDNDFFMQPSTTVPLGPEHKEVISEDLDWHDLKWSDFQLRVVKEEKVLAQLSPLLNFKLYDLKSKE